MSNASGTQHNASIATVFLRVVDQQRALEFDRDMLGIDQRTDRDVSTTSTRRCAS